MKCREAGNVRLAPAQFRGVDALDIEPIAPRPLLQRGEPGKLVLTRRHDQLAAAIKGDAMLGGELCRLGIALPAIARLQAARLVIDPGMHHAAVAPGLVGGKLGFLLHQQDRGAGCAAGELHGGREADNAAADDDEIQHKRSVPAVARRRRAGEAVGDPLDGGVGRAVAGKAMADAGKLRAVAPAPRRGRAGPYRRRSRSAAPRCRPCPGRGRPGPAPARHRACWRP